jgi:hypothetical protein
MSLRNIKGLGGGEVSFNAILGRFDEEVGAYVAVN